MLPDRINLDGAVYIREGQQSPIAGHRVGIAVTTHNRRDIAAKAVENILANTPNALVVVVDDASDKPFTYDGVKVFRFDTQQGIAKAKNKCIEILMDANVEHLFLFDDDCWPVVAGWSDSYTENPEPHLCYLFKDRNSRGVAVDVPKTTYNDGVTWALEHPRGCMLYMHKSVVERIGGFRPQFGIWGHEHVEYSLRANAAGLTLQPFQDVCQSDKLIYAIDANPSAHPGFTKSIPDKLRREENQRNAAVLEKYRGSSDYVEYRATGNAVLTAFLTAVSDPQRNKKWSAKPDELDPWRKSIVDAKAIVFHDQLDIEADGFVRVPSGMNPYAQRWCAYFQYLRSHKFTYVFCTDGTDVTMLRPPWSEITADTLYVGWEPKVLGIPWMTQNHPPYRDWIESNKSKMLLNAGVAGGTYATMLEFCHDMATECLSVNHNGLAGDMAAFNKVVYSDKWCNRFVTGPIVTTLFKHNETSKENQWSWFAHK